MFLKSFAEKSPPQFSTHFQREGALLRAGSSFVLGAENVTCRKEITKDALNF